MCFLGLEKCFTIRQNLVKVRDVIQKVRTLNIVERYNYYSFFSNVPTMNQKGPQMAIRSSALS